MYDSFKKKQVGNLRGAWLVMADIEARPDRAIECRNSRFRPGKILSRDGFSAAITGMDAKIASMHNWIGPGTGSPFNRLAYLRGTHVDVVNLQNLTVISTYTQASAKGLSMAEEGTRLYIAHYDSNGSGLGQVHVVNPDLGDPNNSADKAFMGPLTVTPVITDIGAGSCSAGVHKFGYIVGSRSGFTGTFSPVSGSTFVPVSFTVTSGGRQLRMAITTTWPIDADTVYAVMTTVANPELFYFIPGAHVGVAGGSTMAANITIDFSDGQITQSEAADGGGSADVHQFYLTQDSGGTGPISPSKVFAYGNRMVYIVGNKAYISDPYDFQVITEDLNTVQVEGQKLLRTGGAIRGTAYLIGDNWTYSTQSDPNLAPRQWEVPRLVSESIGSPCSDGFIQGSTGDYGWVIAKSGLWFFNGLYDDKPITYVAAQPDWDRINWNAAPVIRGVDNSTEHCVHVAVPLDSATDPNYMMTFDYSRAGGPNGINVMEVDYSIDDISGGGFGSLAMTQDPTTARRSLWVGPSAAGSILKSVPGAHSDNGAAIHWLYETGRVITPDDQASLISVFPGLHMHVSGSGTLIVTAFGNDHVQSYTPENITLSAQPGMEIEHKFFLLDENVSLRLETNGVGHWANLNSLVFYYADAGTNR